MSNPPCTILFRNTMRVHDGHVGEFNAAITRAVDFTRGHGPQLMVDVFFAADQMLAHSFQLYGEPDQGILDALADSTGGTDIPITPHPRVAGFVR
ncbi:hypothetical protein J4H86_02050 [Spiractinospora alimapuensis]|uniref:hypothetical protein n=1 Tax=Spiractinospora alimapuensis TaxID=2820884 RepID=UPI001F301864|nr:hypothetical protein [Spiractinospora alimapuensis]QVQ52642.1 hypothetical protein J4H86_02050 [Spiractinospora alimapuensis]